MNQDASAAPPLDDRGLPEGYDFDEQLEITPRQVHDMRAGGEPFVLIDCRTPQEHGIVHIEQAELIPLQTAAAQMEKLSAWQDGSIVVHCHHGGRSLQMTQLLRQAGFADVKSMTGGIDLWAIDIEPGMQRY